MVLFYHTNCQKNGIKIFRFMEKFGKFKKGSAMLNEIFDFHLEWILGSGILIWIGLNLIWSYPV